MRAFSQPLLPHLPSPVAVVHFHLTLPPPWEYSVRERCSPWSCRNSDWPARFRSCEDNRGKRGGIEIDSPIVREFRLRYHVCDLTRVEPINQVDSSGCKSTLEFSCAICDRFGAINRSVRYFEFAQGESALHLEKYFWRKLRNYKLSIHYMYYDYYINRGY